MGSRSPTERGTFSGHVPDCHCTFDSSSPDASRRLGQDATITTYQKRHAAAMRSAAKSLRTLVTNLRLPHEKSFENHLAFDEVTTETKWRLFKPTVVTNFCTHSVGIFRYLFTEKLLLYTSFWYKRKYRVTHLPTSREGTGVSVSLH